MSSSGFSLFLLVMRYVVFLESSCLSFVSYKNNNQGFPVQNTVFDKRIMILLETVETRASYYRSSFEAL